MQLGFNAQERQCEDGHKWIERAVKDADCKQNLHINLGGNVPQLGGFHLDAINFDLIDISKLLLLLFSCVKVENCAQVGSLLACITETRAAALPFLVLKLVGLNKFVVKKLVFGQRIVKRALRRFITWLFVGIVDVRVGLSARFYGDLLEVAPIAAVVHECRDCIHCQHVEKDS